MILRADSDEENGGRVSMTDVLRVVILSIVEGLTEFLPVSSTGHLILVNEFVKLEPESFANSFNVIIQLGAILSVVVFYFGKLNPFSKEKTTQQRKRTIHLWKKVVVGVLPAGIFGFLLDDFIDEQLFKPSVVMVALFVWGIFIILIERKQKDPSIQTVYEISYKLALFIGIIQCLALVPGTSRSAATIIGAMLFGCSRNAAAEFSFFLAIPTMLGATGLKLVKMMLKGAAFTGGQWGLLFLGCVLSFAVALMVIRLLMSYIQKHDFRVFGYYRIALSIVLLIYFMLPR